jgi:hypothetical protein
MPLITFKFGETQYVNIIGIPDEFIHLFHNTENNIDQAFTVLLVDYDDSKYPGETKYEFVKSEIRFKTKNRQQLFIPLVSYAEKTEAGKSSPRFHLYDISSEARVIRVKYLDGGNFEELKPFSVFPSDTNHIRIDFGMLQDGKSYKLNVGIWDTVEQKCVDCDPLVGNDPPHY